MSTRVEINPTVGASRRAGELTTARPSAYAPASGISRDGEALGWREGTRLLTAAPTDDVRAVYDHVAPRYEAFRRHWLRLAGAEAEAAMRKELRALLRPGQRVLDAGCGTGAMSRQIKLTCPDVELTMIDFSPQMLARSGDIPGRKILGSVLELPFPDEAFDVVVSAWVIETVADPVRAVSEYLRVLAPEGRVVLTFCSLPEGRFSRAASAIIRAVVKRGFAGNFLDAEHTPQHDCVHFRQRRFHGGLASMAVLRKCCTVAVASSRAFGQADTPVDRSIA